MKPRHIAFIVAAALFAPGVAIAGSHFIITSTSQIKPSVRRALHGANGAPGRDGFAGVVEVEGLPITLPPGGYGPSPVAQCPEGTTVVGTGFKGPLGVVGGFVKVYGTKVGGFFDNESSITVTGEVQAICAQTAEARIASTHLGRYSDDVAAARALVSGHR